MAKQLKFSKKDRLLSRSDFSAVFDAAHRPTENHKTILHVDPYIVYRKSGPDPRLGLSIARRVIRKANERNRIKRCIREFFRLHKDDLTGDYIIRIVSRPKSSDFEHLTKPLSKLLSKTSRAKKVSS